MRTQRFAERRVGGQPGFVRGSQVQLHEPLALLLSDLQPTVHIDQVSEATHLPGEVIRATKGLRIERGELINVLRPSRPEQRLEHRIGENAAVEDVDEMVQARMASRVLV